ncbi:hypothetical protein CRM22_004180 [Opisthorchis felineus]|uniref:PX domain-containing protein n=1 Tax=Opisthorchis felineus TaxID=147828 RepID=A0A4S2LXF8_OPIFE|nr:hypothetical protein CRM22_004180 [Opisthorchis felineus]
MMLVILSVGTLFFLMGYYFKMLLGPLFYPGGRGLKDSDRISLKEAIRSQECSQAHNTSYFNPFRVTVGSKTSDAIESIFDILLDHYVLSWYRTLSDDPDFILQVKLYLQYLSASLVHRIKSIEITESVLDRIIMTSVGHFEHILSALPADDRMESLLEDSVLRAFGSHLHICMASRSSELAYMRALVNRILPLISYPPGLVTPSSINVERFLKPDSLKHAFSQLKRPASQSSARSSSIRLVPVHRSLSNQNLPTRQSEHVSLGANRAAYSFLVEILSTCVLLPAMDAIANPDLLNKFILLYSEPTEDSTDCLIEATHEVPVLNNYVQEWEKWTSEKPPVPLQLERLLRHQEEFHPFMQYMKSIKSAAPLIAVFLISNINRRVLRDPLPPDTCREIRSQVVHLLSLVRDSVNLDTDHRKLTRGEEEEDTTEPQPDRKTQNPRLFALSAEFEALLTDFLAEPTDADSLDTLVHSTLWRDAYQTASQQIGLHFLPMYLESPEYLTHVFGSSWFCPPDRPHTPGASRRGSQAEPNRFENPLKGMFAGHTVEGRVLYSLGLDSNRPPMRLPNRPTKPSSQGLNNRMETLSVQPHCIGSLGDGHHQLRSHYMLQSRPVDLSDWRVYIPGLSRPEVAPGKRLIDQLTQGSNPSSNSPTSRAQYSARPHDASFRSKITNELQNLHASSNAHRMPQLSPQFLFTVRTERVVRGVRQTIARVDRKYSEFYVLEQKLIEFHGSAITQTLPPRKLTPRTFEFLESKRELFEEYLQYLIAQPFLRNSELLHGFLTSKMPFTSSLLFELNLGRFVKSVPLKLIKERGQYLDQFLISFYVSCSPQPILMEPVEPSIEPVFTVFPSSGVGALGGLDALATPDHYSLKPSSSTSSEATTVSWTVAGNHLSAGLGSHHQNPGGVSSSVIMPRSYKRTWLDNRLRVKMFWNNAGLPVERRHDLRNKSCEFFGVQPSGLLELAIYTFKPFAISGGGNPPASVNSSMDDDDPTTCEQRSNHLKKTVEESIIPAEPWNIGSSGWNEALLTAPTVAPTIEIVTPHSYTDSPIAMQHSEEQAYPPVLGDNSTVGQDRTVSISLEDMIAALTGLCRLCSQHLFTHLRFLLLWILYILRGYFKTRIDAWFIGRVKQYMQHTLTDDTISNALQILKATLFYPPTSPNTDLERLERKVAAGDALRQRVKNTGLAFIIDSKQLEERVDKLFLCLQHPKWNKQLTYLLLDQLVTLLFPELTDQANNQQPDS